MKKMVLVFVAAMCMVFKSKAHGLPQEISVDEFDRAIAQLESLRTGREGFQLSVEQLKEVDEILVELKQQRDSIPPGGTFKFPTPDEVKKKLIKLKTSSEWERLSAIEKARVEEVLRDIDRPRIEKRMTEDVSAKVKYVHASPQSIFRHKPSQKEGQSVSAIRLSSPTTNRVSRIRFVPWEAQ